MGTKEEFIQFLKLNNVCPPFLKDAEGKTMEEWIRTTTRADFLIFLFLLMEEEIKKYSEKHKQLIRATIICAKYAKEVMPDILKKALDVFESYIEGRVGEKEFDKYSSIDFTVNVVYSGHHSPAESRVSVIAYCVSSPSTYATSSPVVAAESVCFNEPSVGFYDLMEEMAIKIKPISFPDMFRSNVQR